MININAVYILAYIQAENARLVNIQQQKDRELLFKDTQLQQKGEVLQTKDAELQQKDQVLRTKDAELQRAQEQIRHLQVQWNG